MDKTKQDIRNRQDVALLVRSFYTKVRKDPVLGPIFEAQIDDWESHLVRLTDFWESQLFLKRSFLGNPLAVHQQVDARTKDGIGPYHFGLWLNLWYETLDTLFEGDTVAIAKNRARTMSTMFTLKIHEGRKNREIPDN